MPEPDSFHISWVNERAATFDLHGPATLERQRRIWTMAAHFRTRPHVREVVPGMNNLGIELDPASPDSDRLPDELRAAWLDSVAAEQSSREVDIPVEYGGDAGPDLDEVARHSGLSPSEVVRLHVAGRYTVYFLGFLPGFAYLGGLDPRLATPRRREPRLAVPAGSVGIGGEQTGVYPWVSPGGWQLIGRTTLRLFDASSPSPALLATGDTVRFVDAGGGS